MTKSIGFRLEQHLLAKSLKEKTAYLRRVGTS